MEFFDLALVEINKLLRAELRGEAAPNDSLLLLQCGIGDMARRVLEIPLNKVRQR